MRVGADGLFLMTPVWSGLIIEGITLSVVFDRIVVITFVPVLISDKGQ